MKQGELLVGNIGVFLHRTARTYPDKVAIIRGGARITYAQLEHGANALAHALQSLGLAKGDRVSIMCPNDRHIIEAHFGTLRAGGVYNPLNFRASKLEVTGYCNRAHTRILIAATDYLDVIDAAARGCPDLRHVVLTGRVDTSALSGNVAWHFYDDLVSQCANRPLVDVPVTFDDHCWHNFTSGTTGVPKGSIQTHGRMTFVFVSRMADVLTGLSAADVHLAIGPISHGTGTITTMHAMKGATIVMLDSPGFDPERALQLIEQHRVTNLFTVPTILMDLLKHPAAASYDLTSLRTVIYAGAPISRPDQKLAIERLGSVLVQYYGSAENFGTATVLYPHMHSDRDDDPSAPPGSCGVARTGMDVAILDDGMKPVPVGEIGEICTRGIANFLEYYEMPEATAETIVDGWVRTGDLGRIDERGFFYIAGRSKEMYKSGGLQVYPNETENHLAQHPAVSEAYVVSYPDSRWGETGVAVVTLKSGQEVDEGELIAFIRERLAHYKQPRRIFIWRDVPKTPYGKIPKQLLRDALAQREGLEYGVDVPPDPQLHARRGDGT